MKNTARFFVLLGLSTVSLAAASRKPLPSALRCDFYLTRMSVDFENMGPVWNSDDTASIVGVELKERANRLQDRVIITLNNDKNKQPHYIRPATRLDALLVDYKMNFKTAMLSANVTTNGLLKARIESSRMTDKDPRPNTTARNAIMPNKEIQADEPISKIETWLNPIAENSPSLALTFNNGEPTRYLLRTEADALIFLAAKKLKLTTTLKSLVSGAAEALEFYKAQGYEYTARAGSFYYGKYHTALPKILDIGTDFQIQGIEQYRATNVSDGHTEIYLMRKSDRRSIKIISADYETGLMALELAAGAKRFPLKITQYEALPGDTQNNETVNKFEIVK